VRETRPAYRRRRRRSQASTLHAPWKRLLLLCVRRYARPLIRPGPSPSPLRPPLHPPAAFLLSFHLPFASTPPLSLSLSLSLVAPIFSHEPTPPAGVPYQTDRSRALQLARLNDQPAPSPSFRLSFSLSLSLFLSLSLSLSLYLYISISLYLYISISLYLYLYLRSIRRANTRERSVAPRRGMIKKRKRRRAAPFRRFCRFP